MIAYPHRMGGTMESNILIQNKGIPRCLKAAPFSLIGCRKSQQDFAILLLDSACILACICDGMGGLKGGETASREAAELILKDYQSVYHGETEVQTIPEFFKKEAFKLDNLVANLKNKDGSSMNAGSTIVAALVGKNYLYWLSVGDSRLYLLRNQELIQLTADHNYRSELKARLAQGVISQEYFEQEIHSRKADALTSYLGMGGLYKIDVNEVPFPLKENDELLLCSDGVYKSLNQQQIQAVLDDNRISPVITARRIVDTALQLNPRKQDNTTAVIIQYQKGGIT